MMDGKQCLHGLFREQARRTPDRVALAGDRPVTYKELDVASDKLAAMLLRHGVTKNSSVGILMERCNEYALAYIGIHKAGAGYAVLDVAYPEGLLHDVLETSKPKVVLCKRAYVARLPADQTVILLDSWESSLNDMSPEDVEAVNKVDTKDLDSLAYIVFSSGTSGKPKGIAAPHRGAVFSYEWRFDNIPYDDNVEEVEGCNVFFVWEMLRPLLRGKTLCVIPDDVIYDPGLLSEFIQKKKITRILFTPSLLEAVLDSRVVDEAEMSKRLSSLTTIILCGEVVTVALQQRTKKALPTVRIWNLYSVSECHDVAAIDLADGEYGTRKYCPVGKLFPGVEALVFDENFVQRPVGEEGELYVAGPTLALEYVGNPTLTAERFPTINGKRMYKTGDRARVLHNRELEILGRCDSMVKIRGYSVELRAIEAAIMTLSELVSACSVVVQGEEGEDKFVVAYVVLKDSGASVRKIRLELKAKLPHYMVPAYIIELPELPTHEVSGKLNKKALPKVNVQTGKTGDSSRERSVSTELDITLPRNDLEWDLHRIWCQVMSLQQIDVVVDSFFDCGGHSLLAAKLVQAIKLELDKQISVVDIFTHSTIEALAKLLSGGAQDGSAGTIGAKSVNLHAEVEVYDASKAINDIAMRAFWRTMHFSQVRPRSVLITGATGFLGSYLLFEVLDNMDFDVVYCIVRPSADHTTSVLDRVKSSLSAKGLWRDHFESRIQVFTGDASLHHLGLDDDDYAALSTGVDLVVHCAALVNLVYPYEGLRSANVLATRNMIEFALMGKVKRFGYISTNGVFPDGLKECSETADISDLHDKLQNGYSQTKWVAEILVKRAAERGLPVTIFRPGNMGGDSGSRGGNLSWNTSDFNFLLLTGCIDLGAAPDVSDWLLEITPVDLAAQGIVKVLQDNRAIGETYHVTNCHNCLTADKYFESIRNAGYSLEKCSFKDWMKKLQDSANPSLAKLKNAVIGLNEKALQSISTFNNDHFVEKCAEFGIVLPHISTTLVHEFVEEWQRQGVIAAPMVSTGRLLVGKVAIVTGASSGIGASIARALSEAGAAVGIGGRRLDRLEELAKQISGKTGGKVVAFRVDVTKRDAVKAFVKQCETSLGPCDIYVSNAGVMQYTYMKNLKEDQWEMEVDVNCKGLLHGIGAVLPGMLSRGKGHIVATSSDAGRKVFPGLSVYSGTKFFVEAVCQGLRLENAGTGLRVTTIQPGDCKTELSTYTIDEEARADCAQSSDAREYWLDPEDVARAVLFAVSAPAHVGINEVLVEPRAAPA